MKPVRHPIPAALVLVAALEASADADLRASYKDDFILETADSAFQLKIRGNLHLDLRLFQGEARGAPHSIDIRRARFDLQGRLHRLFTFRVQPEFAGKPYIRNAWLDIGPLSWLHLRLGQMKLPFSSSWLTRDNNVNFVERGTSTPILPFFDRGAILWGELLDGAVFYNLGLFTGVGVDADVSAGDVDDFKELAGRLFVQPLRHLELEPLQGLYLVAEGTWGPMSVPTRRYETGGLRSANRDTAIWSWRTEQTVGTDGRVRDRVSAEVDSRYRLGGELHYLYGPFACSAEYLEAHYPEIVLYHDLFVGSSRKVHQPLLETGGVVRALSIWASVYLTGEHKRLTNGGWRTAEPETCVGAGGPGAWELLGRYSKTWTARPLFRGVEVPGYSASSPMLPEGHASSLPGAGNSVTAAVLDGAHEVHEFTLGLNWTLNPMVRFQLDDVLLWAPENDRDGDGGNDNLLLSGARSGQSDPDLKNRKSRWENAVMARLIFKL